MKRKRFIPTPGFGILTGEASGGRPATVIAPAIPAGISHDLQKLLNSQRDEIIEAVRAELRARPTTAPTSRRSYTVEEVAKQLGKSEYTVREWCRLGRLNATKRAERRGGGELWSISADELGRYQDEGLLPLGTGIATR